MSLQVGLVGEASTVVNHDNTAKKMKSGALDVFATPAMVALMEEAAVQAVGSFIGDGEGTVGIHISTSHDAASPLGANIIAKAELVRIEGRKLTFKIEAYDGETCIGKAEHTRFIINNDKFMAKLIK